MTDDLSAADADNLCTAASVVFFAVLQKEASRRRSLVALPELLCPEERLPPLGAFDPRVIEEATAMLIRLGVIERNPDGSLGIQLLTGR